MFQETKTAEKMTMPFSSTSGAAMPSTPRKNVMPFVFRKPTFSSHVHCRS